MAWQGLLASLSAVIRRKLQQIMQYSTAARRCGEAPSQRVLSGPFLADSAIWLGLKSLPLRHRQQRVAALTSTSPELVCRFRRGDVFPFQTRSLVARQATHSSRAGRPCASIFIGILADNSFPHACTWLTLPGACCRRADSQPLAIPSAAGRRPCGLPPEGQRCELRAVRHGRHCARLRGSAGRQGRRHHCRHALQRCVMFTCMLEPGA